MAREQDAPPTRLGLVGFGRAFLESGVALCACVALGHALEELASNRRLFLDRVPLGPNGGADPFAAPQPFGEHGWLPIPLGLLDMVLLWRSIPQWHATSWWSRCNGTLWGQLPTIITIAFTILPAVLSAWSLWLPFRCTPLAGGLAALVCCLSTCALLFWLDAFPLLPRARTTADTSRTATRRALFCLMHVPLYALRVAYGGGARYVGFEPYEGCASLQAQLSSEPNAVYAELLKEMAAHTPQGAMAPANLVLQVLVACAMIHVAIDAPRGKDEQLWGASD